MSDTQQQEITRKENTKNVTNCKNQEKTTKQKENNRLVRNKEHVLYCVYDTMAVPT